MTAGLQAHVGNLMTLIRAGATAVCVKMRTKGQTNKKRGKVFYFQLELCKKFKVQNDPNVTNHSDMASAPKRQNQIDVLPYFTQNLGCLFLSWCSVFFLLISPPLFLFLKHFLNSHAQK